MAIRKDVEFTVAADGRSVTPTVPQDGGVQGEHNATRVIFHVGENSVWEKPDYTVYIECEDNAGNIDTTVPLAVEGGQVAVLLPLAWTQYGGISTLRLVAEGADGTIAYMAEGAVRVTSRQNASQKVDGLLKGRMAELEQRANDALSGAEGAKSQAEVAAQQASTCAVAAKESEEYAATAIMQCSRYVLRAESAAEAAEDAAGGGESYTIHETEDHSVALSDERGNVVATVKPNGEIDGNFPDKVARKKLQTFVETDKYAAGFCDEQGYVAYGVKPNGEKVGFGGESGGGEGGESGGSFAPELNNCGLPVLYLDGDTEGMSKEDKKTLTYKLTSHKGVGQVMASGTCTCKWQGSSSVANDYPKRNYTIESKTGAFEATLATSTRRGQVVPPVVKAWGEQEKYCLKANWIDPSAARNVVCAKLWGQVVASRENVHEKLAGSPNHGAIDGFPVILVINGEFEGLYTFNIPKEGWMFGMGDGAAEYVVTGESNSMSACGFYKMPTFIEGENQQETDFAIEYQPEGVEDDTVIASFQAAVNAVKDAPDSAGWEAAVEEYFDIDSAIDYYIFNCCISGVDNLRKNILYGTYDGKKWFMSAYDMDTTLGSNPYGTGLFKVKTDHTQFLEGATGKYKHRLFELIYNYSRDKLKARWEELRGGVLSDENVWYVFNNFVNLIPRAVYNMDAEKWADQRDNQKYPMPATTTANVENYMQYYHMHTALLDKEMEE